MLRPTKGKESKAMKKTLSIPYVDDKKTFEIDEANLLGSLLPRVPSGLSREQEKEAVKKALDNPIGTEKLNKLVRSGQRVVLLVDDWTRPTPAYKVIPVVIQELLDCGVKVEDIKIIIARGTHAPLSREQIEKKLGKDTVGRFAVEMHDPDRGVTYLGESKSGTPVYLNKCFVEADVKIAIGWLVAHPIAGYGGGAKIIVPGVASRRTINYNHALCEGDHVAIGIADGNPVREDMEDIARMGGLDFIVNVMLNAKREIVEAVAGDVVAAHREGIKRNRRFYGIKVGEEADIVVLGANPRDATIYHGSFALPCALPLVKSGGTIIWVAPCLSGPGAHEARENFRRRLAIPPDEMMASIKKGHIPASGGVFDWCNAKVVHRNRVVLVSDMINQQEAEEFGFHYGESIQKVLHEELWVNREAKVRVIPVGGLAVPIYG